MGARFVFALLVFGLAAPALHGQDGYNEYEMQYGKPVAVPLDTLLNLPEAYANRAVSTTGRLELVAMIGSRVYALSTLGGRAILVPVPEAQNRWEDDARQWLGREVEVTGMVSQGQDPEQGRSYTVYLRIWGWLGPPEERKGAPPKSADITLEDLVTRPGQRDGQIVRVSGQFRGANLYGDLPSATRRQSADWVIKSDLFAAWISGMKPRGDGFRLDPKLRRDTGKWIEVVGRVRTDRGVVYIDAQSLKLTRPPSPKAVAKEVERAPPPPPEPPVIVFSLPLDGERDVPPNSVFKVQFSEDMDDETFDGNVVLRYAGRPRPGDRPLDAVMMDYDPGRRALTVDPGDLLRPGRVIELMFLPGILDLNGLSLEARPGQDAGAAADVLRFQISPGLVANPSP